MKQYQIDEIRLNDYPKIKDYLDNNYGPADLGNVYWIPLPEHLYDTVQAKHATCHPLYFVIELEESCLTCEFLIRTRNRMRCDCIKYANDKQMAYLILFTDRIFETTNVIT